MKKDTRLVGAGRHPEKNHGFINPSITRGSTVAFESVAAFEHAIKNRYDAYTYGRFGTPTSKAFEEAMAELEGGADTVRSIAVSSGLGAITAALVAHLAAGDHLLAPDNVYGPVRNVSNNLLKRFGVETSFYDPLAGPAIEEQIRDNTALIYIEAPGSLTMEMPDVPAITKLARERGITTAFDNTWATPYFFQPFEHGVDVSIQAATKYIVGHSDAMLGVITVPRDKFDPVKSTANFLGACPAPEDCYLGLRGLRTLGVRLRQHQKNALVIANWLQDRPEVSRVLYPGLPGNPGYELWKRDFTGATGLLSVVLNDYPKEAVDAMIGGYAYFGLGASFGGYESLVLPMRVDALRTATQWKPEGPGIRFHVGLEDTEDLIADLTAGFERLEAASSDG